MFTSFMNLKMSTKILVIFSLYVLLSLVYFINPALPQGIYVVPLYLIAIGIPWRKSWFMIPVTVFLGFSKDLFLFSEYENPLLQKYVVVTIVFALLYLIGAQLKNAYDELTAARDELQHLANMDYLTNLGNHRLFQERLAHELALSEKTGLDLGLIILDIDNFKDFNDTYGHQLGDQILTTLAKIITSNLRSTDLACRYGGEEFVIILPETGQPELNHIGEKIRRAVESAAFLDYTGSSKLKITISGGSACFPHDATNAKDLIRVADQKLYHIKRNCKNQVA